MHALAQKAKLRFAFEVDFDEEDRARILFSNELDQKMQLGRPPLPEAESRMRTIMKKTVLAKVDLNDPIHQETLITPQLLQKWKLRGSGVPYVLTQMRAFMDKSFAPEMNEHSTSMKESKENTKSKTNGEQVSIQIGSSSKPASAAPATQFWASVATCFTCGEEGHVAKNCRKPDVPEEAVSQNLESVYNGNCQNCGMYGHHESDCDTPISVQEPDTCDYCKKEGHHESDCWRLYPELKQKFLEAQKKREEKRYCVECGGCGRPRCHLLHGQK